MIKLIRLFRVDVYMKSGNVIHLDNLTKFQVTKNSGQVTGYDSEAVKTRQSILNLNPDQIEAVIQRGHRLSFRFKF